VAAEAVAELMVAQRNIAAGAFGNVSACAAFQGGGIGSAGAEYQDLLVPFQSGGYGFEQRQGKRALDSPFASFPGHVHDGDGAAAAFEIAVGEGNVAEFACAHVVKAFE